MRILVLGAGGLIGSALLGRLRAEDHNVVAVVRASRQVADPAVPVIELDISKATRIEDWLPHLDGIEAVINCAGVLQDNIGDSTQGVHAKGPGALFAACERAGVRRVLHISAIGADRGGVSDFSRSKIAGEQALMARDLDWVILRPSVVLGRSAYGASALIRGLAALPILPVAANTGHLQVVQLEELLRTLVFFLRKDAPARIALDIAGPERLEFAEVIHIYRQWLGWGPARKIGLPRWASNAMYATGDLISWMGWRPPIRSTARREMVRGAVGDPSEWTRLTDVRPLTLAQALVAEPATVQERWFARLYFLKPLVFIVFALFWMATGILSLGPGWQIGIRLMQEAGAEALAAPAVIAGALTDILIGLSIAYRPTARLGLFAALAISAFYVIAGTLMLPRLWIEPLGALLKIWPMAVLNLVALAILEDR